MDRKKIITIGVVGIIAVIFFIWLTNAYVLRTQAEVKKVDISMTQGESKNGLVPVKFLIQPKDAQDLISGADLRLLASNGGIESWEGCVTLDGATNIFTEMVSTKGKDARYSCVILKSAKELPKVVVVKGTVSCSTNSPMTVSVVKETTEVVGPVEGTKYTLDTVATAQVDCSGTGGGDTTKQTEEILTSFAPQDCRTTVGGGCDYKLGIRARNGKDHISGVYMKLKYDPNILKFMRYAQSGESVQGLIAQATTPTVVPAGCGTDADCPSPCADQFACAIVGKCVIPSGSATGSCTYTNTSTTPTNAPPVTPAPTIFISPLPTSIPIPSVSPVQAGCEVRLSDHDEINGTFSFIYACNKPVSQLPTSFILPLSFKAIGAGTGEMTIDAVQISGPEVAGAYSVAKSKATYNIGGGAGGNIKLNMKLRMQCVVAKPKGADTIKVKVGLADGGLRSPQYQTSDFKVDDKGFWNGSVTFNAPVGGGYKLLPKGEKHMQKKVCVNNPKEDYPGAYSCDKGAMTLRDGDNTIDLSSIVLLSGDLPPGEQDGISNAKDQSLVRNLLGKRDEESAKLADINYDGVVNAVDHSCLIAALAVRWDEQ